MTTLLATLVAIVYGGYAAGWAIPLVDTTRGATLLLGVIGLGMCIVGGSASSIPTKNGFTLWASVLGGLAMLLVLVGLITGWSLAVPLIAGITGLLWAVSTVRHATGAGSMRAA